MGARMVTIEVDPNTAQILETLREKAAAQGMSLDALLRTLAEDEDGKAGPEQDQMNPAEIEQVLDQLAAAGENLPPLPTNFSREDIYFDYD
ncbi:MAG TPA: hypothetical protein VFD58_10650 [Blastocatellia bacterium]|nr:hypothetical protein [Blastocatellia bacterium]